MLFVIGWVQKKHRRVSSLVGMGLMCVLCIERLGTSHTPTGPADPSPPARAVAWSLDIGSGLVPAGFTPLAQRLQTALGAEIDPALANAAVLGLPGDGLATDLIPDIPMASR